MGSRGTHAGVGDTDHHEEKHGLRVGAGQQAAALVADYQARFGPLDRQCLRVSARFGVNRKLADALYRALDTGVPCDQQAFMASVLNTNPVVWVGGTAWPAKRAWWVWTQLDKVKLFARMTVQ